eukprot:4928385-Alexandrium_andersonii.AAC.1
MPGVSSMVGDMCRFGARACVSRQGTARGPGSLVRKPARWAHSAPELLRRSGARCGNGSRASSDPRWRHREPFAGQGES